MSGNKNIKIFKYFFFFIYVLFSGFLFFWIYRKTYVKLNDIFTILTESFFVFVTSIFLSFIATILKVLRWKILIEAFLSSSYSFFYLLSLTSFSLVLNSVGLNLVFSDGVKSGILAIKGENVKNKIFLFFTPYVDRIVGIISAVIMAAVLVFKNFFVLLISIMFLIGLYLVTNDKIFKIILITIFISFLSHLLDAFSLFSFLIFVFDYKISFYEWFLAFILGSFGSLLSVFGGLGGRSLGMSILLGHQNLKTAFLLDIIYYFLQLSSAVLGLLIFGIYKIFYENKNSLKEEDQ